MTVDCRAVNNEVMINPKIPENKHSPWYSGERSKLLVLHRKYSPIVKLYFLLDFQTSGNKTDILTSLGSTSWGLQNYFITVCHF